MTAITSIEGIGGKYAEQLKAAGVASVEALLDKGAIVAGRSSLAQQTGISEKLILRWVNHADLFRIKGIGGQFAELLEVAGVDSVAELAQRNAQTLHDALSKANEQKRIAKATPAPAQINEWLTQAKALPRIVKY